MELGVVNVKIPCNGEGILELVASEEVGDGEGTLPPAKLPPPTDPPPAAPGVLPLPAFPPMPTPLVGDDNA